MPTLEFSPERMYTFVKGYATALDWSDVLSSLPFARKAHGDQARKDGQPYITHPLTMACHALALGVRNQSVIAACLLHDVCEDCGAKPEDLPVSGHVQDVVRRLTHIKSVPLDVYYAGISTDPDAGLAKILDRCHNVSSMAGTFTARKCRAYIAESEEYVMPLFRTLKDACPMYSSALFVLKYHIQSVDNSLKALLDGMDRDAAAGPAPDETGGNA